MTTTVKENTIEFTAVNNDSIRINTKENEKSILFEAWNETKKIRICGFYSNPNKDPFLNIQVEWGHACHYFSGDLKMDTAISTGIFGEEFVIPVLKEVLEIDKVKDETLAEIYNKISVRYCMFMHKHGNQGYEMYTHHKIEDPLGWGWNID